MPLPYLNLVLASGLAAQFLPLVQHHAPEATAAQTHYVCHFSQGPRAGHELALPPSNTLKLGEACADGAGSSGLVAIATIPTNAGISDIYDKIRNATRGDTQPTARPEPRPPAEERLPQRPPVAAGRLPAPTERPRVQADTAEVSPESGHGDLAPAPPPPVGAAPAAESAAEAAHHNLPPVAAPKPAPPAQTESAAPPSPAAEAQSPAAPAPPDVSQQVHVWYENLQKGSADYNVPTSMVIGSSYSATAVIHPPATAASAGPDAHALKISPYMRIVLSQTANPGTFQIDPPNGECKFVSQDADTTWTFQVKPLLPGEDRALDFSAYVVYGTDDASCSPANLKIVDVLSDTKRVTIAAITRQQAWQEIVVAFLSNPTKWFEFILPGGLGFAALKWLISWWNKRRKATRAPSAPAPHAP